MAAFDAFLVGAVGRQPHQFRVFDIVLGLPTGPAEIELLSEGDRFWLYVDGVERGGPWDVPPGLRGSTAHGVALDLNQDPERRGGTPVLGAPFHVGPDDTFAGGGVAATGLAVD